MRRRILFLASLVVCFGTATNAVAAPLEFSRCQVKSGALIVDAQCALFKRAENPDRPDGRTIDLFVAKFPASTPQAEADAFTVIQGGPGGSSIDLYLRMRHLFSGIQKKRDIIVVDQRGTGRSNMLGCPSDDEEFIDTDFDPELTKKLASECLENLSKNSESNSDNPAALGAVGDARFYTTSIAVQDLEALREAAGYPQLNIYGTSYGTRVAQHYVRRFPEQTRSIILDGVAHVGLNLAGGEIARRSQEAFDRIVGRCKALKPCAEQLGDINRKFQELRIRLDEQAIKVNFPHPNSGQAIEKTISEQSLLSLVRLLPYSSEQSAMLPLHIAQAHAGNYVPLAAWWTQLEEGFLEGYAIAMNNSVVCAEDYPFLKPSDLDGVEQTYFGIQMADSMRAICEVWPRGPVDDDFLTPFESAVPALILSGEVDPITPPVNGDLALEMFNNAKHIVVPAQGHGVISRGCIPQLAQDFIKTLVLDSVNTDCVNREITTPLFLDFTGAKP
jgi:pimeloyl-ACP methyl ester carboxylesterase